MRRNDGTEDQFIGQQLPGTGGDARRRDDDVEGHARNLGKEEARRDDPEGLRRDDPEGLRRDDDVEGHARQRDDEGYKQRDDAEGARRDDDVEGHVLRRDSDPEGLYRGGPTTQGEVIRRGPGDNPHGER
jgi:hypothetical protein